MNHGFYNMDCMEGMRERWLPILKLYSYTSDWKINKKYELKAGRYFISDKGRFIRDGQIINVKPDSVGTYTLFLGGHRFKLHQIVLQTFIPDGICDGYSPDHINRNNRHDNSLANLRWADRTLQYQNRENRRYKIKPVYCNEINRIFPSCQDAEKHLGLVANTVSRVARGERKSIKGYTFQYFDMGNKRLEDHKAQINMFEFVERI